MRKRYLIAYDISDDKRRNGVYKLLMENGDHVQFSVFLSDLNKVELERLRGELAEIVNHRQDQIIVLDMGPAETGLDAKLECIGKGYSPPGRVMVV